MNMLQHPIRQHVHTHLVTLFLIGSERNIAHSHALIPCLDNPSVVNGVAHLVPSILLLFHLTRRHRVFG